MHADVTIDHLVPARTSCNRVHDCVHIALQHMAGFIKGFFTEFWNDPQPLERAHLLRGSFADVITPVSFVMLSYMDEWALSATCKNRARREATLKELKVKSWFDNDVFDLVDIRKFKPKNFVTGRWMLTVKRDRDGKFQKSAFKIARKMLNKPIALHQHVLGFGFFVKMQHRMVGR